MRLAKSTLLAWVVLVPLLADTGAAEQRTDADNKPLACNSTCNWWMALGEQPAAASTPPRDAEPAPGPRDKPSPSPSRPRPVPAPARVALPASPRQPATAPRVAVGRASVRTEAAAVEPARLTPGPARPARLATTPAPVAASDVQRVAQHPADPSEDRADRARRSADASQVIPTTAVAVQSAALLTPRRARVGLLTGLILCGLAFSLRRAGRARVVPDGARGRRGQMPLLDAFKAERRAGATRT